jgi:hypothetical protein
MGWGWTGALFFSGLVAIKYPCFIGQKFPGLNPFLPRILLPHHPNIHRNTRKRYSCFRFGESDFEFYPFSLLIVAISHGGGLCCVLPHQDNIMLN